jgi:hypothetical protein
VFQFRSEPEWVRVVATRRKTMLVLLSSGARSRYREDIIRCLALPKGLESQFRYELSLAENDIISAVNNGTIVNRDAIICYVHTSVKGAPVRFVACRMVKITKAVIVGTSLIINFYALEYPDISSIEYFENELHSAVGKRLPAWISKDNDFKLTGFFVLDAGQNLTFKKSIEIACFEKIVKQLCLFHDFSRENGRIFYNIIGINEISVDSWGNQIVEKDIVLDRGVYIFKSGNHYDMSVYVFLPDDGVDVLGAPSYGYIGITSDNKSINFTYGSLEEIDSEYDMKHFRFYVEPQTFRSVAALRIFISSARTDENLNSDILIPAVFEGRPRESAYKAVLLGIASSGPAIISAYAADKLSLGNGLLMMTVAFAATLGSVFFPTKK